ncbi:squalene/phytoene synthase family protein [Streptomyces sp. NBC_01450]|uniref:squalene/phytoene synthase family protein n=1 Tax=Streptomyces sp. NBC_01450 TaxID=2903871 RepID=UPI003FCE2D2A
MAGVSGAVVGLGGTRRPAVAGWRSWRGRRGRRGGEVGRGCRCAADGRLTIPEQTLAQYHVTRADLEQAHDLPTVRALITDLLDRTDRALAEGRTVIELAPPAHRPMIRCMIRLDELTSAAADPRRGR